MDFGVHADGKRACPLVTESLAQRALNRVTVVAIITLLATAVAASLWQSGAFDPGLEYQARIEAILSARGRSDSCPVCGLQPLADRFGPRRVCRLGSAALTLNLVVAAMVLKLDANFMEASAAASQRRYEFMRRAQRGSGVPAIGLRSKPRFALPRFPWLAGGGPVAWRETLDFSAARAGFCLLPRTVRPGFARPS